MSKISKYTDPACDACRRGVCSGHRITGYINITNDERQPVYSEPLQKEMVNYPEHYLSNRGPKINGRNVECIEIIRHIKDGRLFNAMKYIWRVAFGGKGNDREDIKKAIWYLNDWLENKV